MVPISGSATATPAARRSVSAAGLPLRELLPQAEWLGAADVRVTACCSDSRQVQPGDLFVALAGVEQDGHEHAAEALRRGAAAFLVERPLPVAGRPQAIVSDVADAHGHLCQALVGHPSRRLKVVGITGTNGKTTTTALAASVLGRGGPPVGQLGTLGFSDGLETAPATHTTPPAVTLAHWLARMTAAGCRHAVMEVSSHALAQSRVAGVEFDAACFTNVRRDHLDYHNSLANYRRAKARLLDHLAPDGLVVINADDPVCRDLIPQVQHPLLTVGMHAAAEIEATVVERRPDGQTFLLHAGSETAAVHSAMLGDHHVSNCLVAAALGVASGLELTEVAAGLEAVERVAGRLERIVCGQPFAAYVDYAHTPDALEVSLETLRQVTPGRIFCVFGAGGDRDRPKRPLMGAAVERLADVAVITSDNPRGEDPATIAADVQAGFARPHEARVVLDRAAAIRWALAAAREGDAVLVAGKGHEDYQIVGGRRLHFDDREMVREALYARPRKRAPLPWASPS